MWDVISSCAFCHGMSVVSHCDATGLWNWPDERMDSGTGLQKPITPTHWMHREQWPLLTPPHVYHKMQAFYLSLTPFKLNQTTESFQRSWNTRRLCELNTLIAALFLSLSLSFSQCLEYFPQQLSSILHKAVIVEQSWREGVHECLP